MLILAQIVGSSLLVALSSAVVLFWLLLLAASFSGGLMPWVEAGVVLYGPALVSLAVLPGIPGIAWAHRLARQSPSRWQRIAKVPVWLGVPILAVGLASALAVFLMEHLRERRPVESRVIYRDAAASAAPAASRAGSASMPLVGK